MSKLKIALGVALMFLLGVLAGGYGGFVYAASIFSDFIGWTADVHTSMEISASVARLQLLRASRTDKVIESLEVSLDDALAIIGMKPIEVDDSTRRILQRAAQYRSQYPRKSSHQYPEFDQAIERALAQGVQAPTALTAPKSRDSR
jgi:hypothetical protein